LESLDKDTLETLFSIEVPTLSRKWLLIRGCTSKWPLAQPSDNFETKTWEDKEEMQQSCCCNQAIVVLNWFVLPQLYLIMSLHWIYWGSFIG